MVPTRWLYLGDAGFNARENRRRHRGRYGLYADRAEPPLQKYCGHGTPNTAKTGIVGVRRRRGPDATERNTLSVTYAPFSTHFALAASSLKLSRVLILKPKTQNPKPLPTLSQVYKLYKKRYWQTPSVAQDFIRAWREAYQVLRCDSRH